MSNILERAQIVAKSWLPKPPPGYSYPPKTALENIGVLAMALANTGPKANPHRMQDMLGPGKLMRQLGAHCAIDRWLLGNGPTFYPSVEILDLCDQTDVMASATGSDIKTVLPQALICLPDEFSARCGKTTHILYGFSEAGESIESKFMRTEVANGNTLPRTLYANYFENTEDGGWMTSSILTDRPLSETIESVATNVDSKERENIRLVSLLFNLLLVMQSYPDYIERMEPQYSQRGHMGGNKPKPYSARIARPFRQTTQDEPAEAHAAEGTHRSPKSHWRRGHWRRTPHSPQWEAANLDVGVVLFPDGRRAHMSWLKPVLVNRATTAAA